MATLHMQAVFALRICHPHMVELKSTESMVFAIKSQIGCFMLLIRLALQLAMHICTGFRICFLELMARLWLTGQIEKKNVVQFWYVQEKKVQRLSWLKTTVIYTHSIKELKSNLVLNLKMKPFHTFMLYN